MAQGVSWIWYSQVLKVKNIGDMGCLSGELHRWELLGNLLVFNVVMVIYHDVERIWRILVTPNFYTSYVIANKYYPGEPVNIHIKSLINIFQENNWGINTKKGKGRLP